jgi:hypothetical protein
VEPIDTTTQRFARLLEYLRLNKIIPLVLKNGNIVIFEVEKTIPVKQAVFHLTYAICDNPRSYNSHSVKVSKTLPELLKQYPAEHKQGYLCGVEIENPGEKEQFIYDKFTKSAWEHPGHANQFFSEAIAEFVLRQIRNGIPIFAEGESNAGPEKTIGGSR